ncbi:unnamed protein product [Darwinula stevensoni]|uniref:Peptidase M13 N-terminal domain-containing protein n=1 Tax=Darwinula stevensoni TaxID=69355 RepID=A0A7R9A8E8_9CRUS|nr:unnamed protein product [Darwinula stevensoni]CAG0896274.1 unnamed protein product [Darwinula stevensoni]
MRKAAERVEDAEPAWRNYVIPRATLSHQIDGGVGRAMVNGGRRVSVEQLWDLGGNSKWKMRSQLEKLLCLLSACLFVFMAAAITISVLLYLDRQSISSSRLSGMSRHPSRDGFMASLLAVREKRETIDDLENKAEVCTSRDCALAAGNILSSMDTSVDPCEDFYTYACGRWIRENPIPDFLSRWGRFDQMERDVSYDLRGILEEKIKKGEAESIKKMKTFYRACMELPTKDEGESITPLLSDLRLFLGGWPMTMADGEWNPDGFSWLHTVARMRGTLGLGPLVTSYVHADEKNNTNSFFFIDQPWLGVDREVLLHPEYYGAILSGYKDYILDVAQVVSIYEGVNKSREELGPYVDDIIRFETELAMRISSAVKRREPSWMYKPMTLRELQNITDIAVVDGADWENYTNTVLSIAGMKVTKDSTIFAPETEYLKHLLVLLDATDPVIVGDEGNGKNQAHSQTKWVSAYVLHKQLGMAFPYTLTLVDTPGFGDTEGMKRDDELKNQIEQFFSHGGYFGVDQLDGVALERMELLRKGHAAVRQHGGELLTGLMGVKQVGQSTEEERSNANSFSSDDNESEYENAASALPPEISLPSHFMTPNDNHFLTELSEGFKREMVKFQELIKEAHACMHRIDEIALRPNPIEITNYIEMLIRKEFHEEQPGFSQRIKYLEEARRKSEVARAVLESYDPNDMEWDITMFDTDEPNEGELIKKPMRKLFQKLIKLFS